MVQQAQRQFRRIGRLASVCQAFIGSFAWGGDGAPRVPSRGEADQLPRPGVYALLAGFDRH